MTTDTADLVQPQMETNCDQTDMKVTPDPEKGEGAMEAESEPVEAVEDDYIEGQQQCAFKSLYLA